MKGIFRMLNRTPWTRDRFIKQK